MTEATLIPDLPNKEVEGLSYFTPSQDPVAGSTKTHTRDDESPVPKLFEPLKIRDVKFQNRIFVSLQLRTYFHIGRLHATSEPITSPPLLGIVVNPD